MNPALPQTLLTLTLLTLLGGRTIGNSLGQGIQAPEGLPSGPERRLRIPLEPGTHIPGMELQVPNADGPQSGTARDPFLG